jgi:endonuclease I
MSSNQHHRIHLGAVIGLAMSGLAVAQTQPPPQALPVLLDFGTTPFSTLPTGMAAWGGLNGGSLNTAAAAAGSSPTADAVVSAATTSQTTGGVYGYATGGNGRCYIQTSGNATNGVNQLVLAIDTSGRTGVTLSYDLEIVNAQPRTVGVVCQYRVGASGGWTTLIPAVGSNPFSQAGGSPGPAGTVAIPLPDDASNQPFVQLRWATWRGAETGNSSGVALDNVAVAGTAVANSLAIELAPATIPEAAGVTTVTVTTATPAGTNLPVTLTVADPTEAVVVTANPQVIPAGSATAVFSIHAVDDLAFDGPQAVAVTATAPGALAAAADLTISDNEDAWSPPEAHYAAASGLTGAALKAALKTIAATGHRQAAYSATLAPLRALHPDPANSANVVTVYSGTVVGKNAVYRPDAGLDPDLTWSREHVWPVSYGLDPEGVDPGATDGDAGPDYTDLFNLRPAIHTVNSQRGNLYFDETSGTPFIPALAPQCSSDGNSWEPRDSEKGDLARAMFYMATRYDGSEPLTIDLELGNTPAAAAGRFGRLATLLEWHAQDPVSLQERQQNQLIFTTYQGNRNPFVDHPEYVALIWTAEPAIAPAPLPLVFGGPWSPLPSQGFLAVGTGTYSTSLGGDEAPGSAKFDDPGDRLTIAFSGSPGALSYQLKGNPSAGTATAGVFQVLQSADGVTFTVVRSHVNKSNAVEAFTEPLLPTTRLVAFLYDTKASGNLQLDQLAITAGSPWTAWLAQAGLSGAGAAPDADPDFDSLTNLAEYALGRSPLAADAGTGRVAVEKVPGKLRLTVDLRANDPALTTAAETSIDPANPAAWTAVGVVRTVAVDQSGVAAGFVRTVFEVADGGAPARFVRLRCGLN